MAVNCCVAPAVTDGLAGVTAIETKVGAVTVRTVDPLIVPEVAVIVVNPALSPLARPPEATVATLGVEELQVTEEVMSRVLPSS